MTDDGSHATPVDRAFQVAYKVAHRLLRLYWAVRRPHKGGTLIAVWNAGEILILKNSYRKQYSLPGGYPRPGETPRQTGARELEEECGVRVHPDHAREVYRGEYLFEGRHDCVTIVEIDLPTRPAVHIDHREIASARFAAPGEALGLLIVPHLREYLARRAAGESMAVEPKPAQT